VPESPQRESPNTLTIDFSDSPEVKEIFLNKDIGEKCKLTVELQIISRYPEGVQCAIEKIITDEYDYATGGDKSKDVKPDNKEPVMMRMKSKNDKTRGMSGPHGLPKGGPKSRPPQTAENSAEPWLTSYT